MQHPDVEPTRHRVGVADSQVVERGRLLETAAMQSHPQRLYAVGDRFSRVEHMHIGREREPLGHLAIGVVVAVQKVNGNSRLVQAPHLTHEEVAGVVVTPVAVVEVTRDHHKIDLFFDRLVDQVPEGVPRRCAQGFHRGVLVRGQAAQRAV